MRYIDFTSPPVGDNAGLFGLNSNATVLLLGILLVGWMFLRK
jgi:hypothetical protein